MTLREEIIAKAIQAAAASFGVDPAGLNENTHFDNDLSAKSPNLIQIIAALEDEFDVELPFMEFRRKKTIADVATYVEFLIEG